MDSAIETLDIIPVALMEKLTSLRPVLERQGAVLRRGDRTGYRLRFRQDADDRGYRVCRSVKLADERVADAVQALIAGWRGEKDEAGRREVEEQRQKRLEERKDKALVRLVVAADGGGGRRQRRAIRMYNAAAQAGPLEMWKFALSRDFLKRGKPGRRHRRLW